MNLTGLKVKIGLKDNAQHKFPTFNELPVVIASGVDWAYYVDMFGLGWCYDKKYGHKDEGPDTPAGEWWGCLLVPQQFATEAVAEFPTECSAMTEAEYQDFHDTRAMIKTPENNSDDSAINEAKTEFDVAQRLSNEAPGDQTKKARVDTAEIKLSKVLDRDDDTPGVRKNYKRYWSDHKVKSGITYV